MTWCNYATFLFFVRLTRPFDFVKIKIVTDYWQTFVCKKIVNILFGTCQNSRKNKNTNNPREECTMYDDKMGRKWFIVTALHAQRN